MRKTLLACISLETCSGILLSVCQNGKVKNNSLIQYQLAFKIILLIQPMVKHVNQYHRFNIIIIYTGKHRPVFISTAWGCLFLGQRSNLEITWGRTFEGRRC